MKKTLLNQGSTLAVCLAAGLWAGSAAAQSADSEVSEVIVTGSFIAGTPEDAALPVDVIGADELERQGNPTTIELMKNLTVSGGIVGDHNQYAGPVSGTPAGVATVNLRNLGATRTLVLLNGRRLASIPTVNGPVDVNSLPQAAIGRIEILKDGAAATYGSDAIGGVVNFITRKNFDGLQVSADYRYIAGADEPDYSASAIWGWQGERGDVLLSAGWQVRGRLRGNERDWNLPSYLENPDAGFSFTNNPTSFLPLTGTSTLGAQMRDPGCATVGAQAGFVGGNQVCLARIAGAFINLIDPTSRWQLYGETNFELSDNVKFHAEAFYTETKAVQRSSPGYPNTAPGPTSLTSPFPGNYFVPASNPGLTLLRQQFPNAFPAALTGVVFPAINFRPFGLGGNPFFDGDDGTATPVIQKTYRLSGGFSGKVFDDAIGWDLAATFHNINIVTKGGWDTIVSRTQLALRGFGALAGDTNGCTASETANFTTNAGNNTLGCYYFNPFSNSFPANSQFSAERPGAANPLYNSAVANPLELVKWVGTSLSSDSTARLFVLDGVLNGELPIEFSGGKIGWAAGGQFRRNFYRTNYGPLNNRLVTPCPDILIGGTCTTTPGPFSLQSSSLPANIVQNVYAGFAEMAFPFTDNFSAHIAARYENYGENEGGDTFNPKLDVRWQALDWLSFRCSVGTTFRATPL
ncbi:MAG: TonB-dependent receptor, partial [Hyphomonadaceae bacterium]|nr:TonB-dependent receptor [Hyphomonadaceae bacterium]